MAQTKKTVKKTDTKSRQTKIKENKLSDRVKAIIFLALAILIFAITLEPNLLVIFFSCKITVFSIRNS